MSYAICKTCHTDEGVTNGSCSACWWHWSTRVQAHEMSFPDHFGAARRAGLVRDRNPHPAGPCAICDQSWHRVDRFYGFEPPPPIPYVDVFDWPIQPLDPTHPVSETRAPCQ